MIGPSHRVGSPTDLLARALGSFAPYPRTAAAAARDAARVTAQVNRALPELTRPQARLVRDVRSLGISDLDLFRGAHVVVTDKGTRYWRWRELGSYSRGSSHYPELPSAQQAIDLGPLGTCLFGLDGADNTWFQLEAHGVRSPRERARHVVDYLAHAATRRNVGPMGLSPFTEKRGREHVVELGRG